MRATFVVFSILVASGSTVLAAEPAPEGVDLSSIPAGLAVHLGATDGSMAVRLARGGRTLVHALAPDDAARDAARRAIDEAGLYGLASVETATTLPRLPYADNLVNVLLADVDVLGSKAPSEEEILRVLAPRGTAHVRRGGKWIRLTKPVPATMDEWTHWDHGPSGNPASEDTAVGPTTSLRWYAGPSTADNAANKVGLRIAGGRLFYYQRDYELAGVQPRGSRRDLVARNAANGLLLWKHPFEDVPGRGDDPPRFALTAVGERVYAILEAGGPLEALEAATGRTVLRYDLIETPPAYGNRRYWDKAAEDFHFLVRVFDGKLLAVYKDTATLVDEGTGKPLWRFHDGRAKSVGWAVAGQGKVFLALAEKPLAKFRSSAAFPVDALVALDAATGRELWRNEDCRAGHAFRIAYHDGRVIVPWFTLPKGKTGSSYANDYKVTAVAASDGTTLWTNDGMHHAHGHYQVVLVRGGRVYVGNQTGFSLDLADGRFLADHQWGQYDSGCADLKCTPEYVFYGLTFIDADGRKTTRGQTRSRCDTGVFPAYGMMVAGPSGCLCSNFVNGYVALAPDAPPKAVPAAERLQPGPAFNQIHHPISTIQNPDEWPIHLADARRGSSTACKLPEKLEPLWTRPVGKRPEGLLAADWADNEQIVGPMTPATVAAGKVFLAAPDLHRLVALDAETGEPAWQFTAGGRIDSPPTVHEGLCLFGSRDGWVYCLRAQDGRLVWRFLAAVCDKRVAVGGQLESAWPVHGSVMIHQGKLVFTAGRQSALDEGIQVYCLVPQTGELVWKTRIWTDPDVDPAEEGNFHRYQPDLRRVQCLLVSDGRRLFHAIDPLSEGYAPGETVSLVPRTASDRGGWIHSTRDPVSAREITCLWANSNGFLSRRTESVGRNDFVGTAYSDLMGDKLVLAGDRLYRIARGGYGTRSPGLTMFPLDAEGRPSAEPSWTAKIDTGRNHYTAFVLAGVRLLLAGHRQHSEEAFLHVRSAGDGSLVDEMPLPTRPVRDGLSVAYGRLYVACEDGVLHCFGG